MEDNILVSIITPLYNYRKYIGYCIQSVINQKYGNFEMIIVDDCSTDNSQKEVKKYMAKDGRIKLIRMDKNSGYSKAKNEGIVLSKGEYIVTIDADDMLTKDSIGGRLRAAIEHNVEFVYADAYFVRDAISLKECYATDKHQVNPSLDLYNIHAQSVLMHRGVYQKYGLYDENLRSRSDREMWWRLFGKCDTDKKRVTSFHLQKPVAYYRYHRYSMWRKRKRKPELDRKVIKKSERAYEMRKRDGINKNNTRFLEA